MIAAHGIFDTCRPVDQPSCIAHLATMRDAGVCVDVAPPTRSAQPCQAVMMLV
jgi:hypothetical protein